MDWFPRSIYVLIALSGYEINYSFVRAAWLHHISKWWLKETLREEKKVK